MTDLSFLPPEDQPRRHTFRWRLVGAIAAITALGVTAALYFAVQVIDYQSQRSEVERLEVELGQLKSVEELEKKMQAAEKLLKEQRDALKAYRTAANVRQALEVLNESVPKAVLLDSFKLGPDRKVQLTGVAPNLTDVARVVTALESSGTYRSTEARFPQPFVAGASEQSVTPLLQPSPATGEEVGIRFELNAALVER